MGQGDTLISRRKYKQLSVEIVQFCTTASNDQERGGKEKWLKIQECYTWVME